MPHISGQVNENKQTAEQLQKKLEDYEPILKVMNDLMLLYY